MHKPLFPPPLQRGEKIAVIAPAGQIGETEHFTQGVRILKEMGFEVSFPERLWTGHHYFSNTDEQRIKEFNHAWADPDIRAIIALRGGYGCIRILQGLDLKQIKANPKMLVGFSDITILHSYLSEQTGLVSLHGPVVTSLAISHSDSLERFFHCLKGDWHHAVCPRGVEIIRGTDEVRGILCGGNVTSLVSLLGTPYEPQWHGKILFLEDVNEPLYCLDRMFTQLQLAGKLQGLAGIILGDFTTAATQDPLENLRHHEFIWNMVADLTHKENTPLWGGYQTGHCQHNLTLPIGAEAVMDSCRGSLSFL